MKKEELEELIRNAEEPKELTKERLEELNRLAERPDDEIDLTDPDCPPLTDEDFSRAVTGKFYRPGKEKDTTR